MCLFLVSVYHDNCGIMTILLAAILIEKSTIEFTFNCERLRKRKYHQKEPYFYNSDEILNNISYGMSPLTMHLLFLYLTQQPDK